MFWRGLQAATTVELQLGALSAAPRAIRSPARRSSIPATAATGWRTYKNAYPDYSVPKLRHQNAAYIIAALHEYKSGQRPHSDHACAGLLAVRSGHRGHRRVSAGSRAGEAVHATDRHHAAAGARRAPPATARMDSVWRRRSIPSRRYSPDSTSIISTGAHVLSQRRRKNVVMNGMAQLLDDANEDIKVVADYFAQPALAARDRHDRQQIAPLAGFSASTRGTARTRGSTRRGSASLAKSCPSSVALRYQTVCLRGCAAD